MARRSWILLLIGIGLILLVAALPDSAVHLVMAQGPTIPTPTPKPSATPAGGGSTPAPTATSQSGGGGQPQPTKAPQATATNQVGVPTSTQPAIAPTPEGGFLATAEACGSAPTVQSQASGVNVRQGPGLEYPVVGDLLYLEVRPIIGRAQYASWWQIELDGGETGWIANSVVSVDGYTADVPLIPAPALPNGQTPTPGALWQPTPNPQCTPVPTATPTGTVQPSRTATATATETLVPSSTPTDEPTPTTLAASNEPEDPADTEEAVAGPVVNTPVTTDVEVAENVENAEVAESAPVEEEGGIGLLWLPVVGLVMAGAGAVLLFTRRNGA